MEPKGPPLQRTTGSMSHGRNLPLIAKQSIWHPDRTAHSTQPFRSRVPLRRAGVAKRKCELPMFRHRCQRPAAWPAFSDSSRVRVGQALRKGHRLKIKLVMVDTQFNRVQLRWRVTCISISDCRPRQAVFRNTSTRGSTYTHSAASNANGQGRAFREPIGKEFQDSYGYQGHSREFQRHGLRDLNRADSARFSSSSFSSDAKRSLSGAIPLSRFPTRIYRPIYRRSRSSPLFYYPRYKLWPREALSSDVCICMYCKVQYMHTWYPTTFAG